MRKNSPRKWLHAVLDLLPVILIPVFMIYSHRHEINTGSIQVQEKVAVNYNQLIPTTANFNFAVGDRDCATVTNNGDGTYTVNVVSVPTAYTQFHYNILKNDTNVISGNIYYVKGGYDYNLYFTYYGVNSYSPQDYAIGTMAFNSSITLGLTLNTNTPIGTYLVTPILGNLTFMFGSGNEPTASYFDELFPYAYYDYTPSTKMLIDKPTLTTFNDTDIMSQMTYQLYNSVDKYFNMGNVFNLNGVYDWFNLNIFNGTAPVYVYIVWQIVLYEFVMDLLFLLYGLFMWFIDMVQHIMDKPFKSIK